MNNVKAIQKINAAELQSRTKKSWHDMYSHSAYIFIGGLNYDLTEGDVIAVFSQYGEIVNINLVRDKKTGKPKGFCFLCYDDQRSTILAVDNLNGIKLCGRTIRVDHVNQYRRPKDEGGNEIVEKGCAPNTPTPSPSPSPPPSPKPVKEKEKKVKKSKDKKKKRKHKSKKKQRGSSDSDLDEQGSSDDNTRNEADKESMEWTKWSRSYGLESEELTRKKIKPRIRDESLSPLMDKSSSGVSNSSAHDSLRESSQFFYHTGSNHRDKRSRSRSRSQERRKHRRQSHEYHRTDSRPSRSRERNYSRQPAWQSRQSLI